MQLNTCTEEEELEGSEEEGEVDVRDLELRLALKYDPSAVAPLRPPTSATQLRLLSFLISASKFKQ